MPADENFASDNAGSVASAAQDNLLGVHSRIGAQLRAFYTEIEEQAIPEHLLILLERLDEAENSSRINVPKAGGDLTAGKGNRHG